MCKMAGIVIKMWLSANITDQRREHLLFTVFISCGKFMGVNYRRGSGFVEKLAWIWQLQQHHHSGSPSYLQQKESQVKCVTNTKTHLTRLPV